MHLIALFFVVLLVVIIKNQEKQVFDRTDQKHPVEHTTVNSLSKVLTASQLKIGPTVQP